MFLRRYHNFTLNIRASFCYEAQLFNRISPQFLFLLEHLYFPVLTPLQNTYFSEHTPQYWVKLNPISKLSSSFFFRLVKNAQMFLVCLARIVVAVAVAELVEVFVAMVVMEGIVPVLVVEERTGL